MITRGVSDIKGLHSLTTVVGPLTEKKGFLKLYQLSAEKDNLGKRLEWVGRQRSQMEERLSEIVRTMRLVKERTQRDPASDSSSKSRDRSSRSY